MAQLLDVVQKGSTDRSVTVRIIDSTDGTPETSVVYNTGGIDLWYRREGAALSSITEADLTTPALDDAHADGGFLHISDGEYRLDLPDAAFATGANYVDVGGTVTGMVVIGGRVRLVDYDPEDSVRLGLTGVPNATPGGNGGLPTVDANNRIVGIQGTINTLDALDTAQDTQHADTQSDIAGLNDFNPASENVTLANGAHGGAAAVITLQTPIVANATQIEGVDATDQINAACDTAIAEYDGPTNAEMEARTVVAANYATQARMLAYFQLMARSDAAIETDNSTELGEINADGGSGAGNYSAQTDAVEALRDHIGDGTNLTEAGGTGNHLTGIPWNAAWDAEVQSEVEDGLAVYDPPTRAELTTDINSVLTRLGTPADTDVSTDLVNLASDIAGLNDLSQANIRSAVGLSSANLDTQLSTLSSGIITGAAQTGTLSTTVATTDLAGYGNDRIIGRVLIWLTGTAAGEATRITDYASTNGTITYTTMSVAPSNTDTFKIV